MGDYFPCQRLLHTVSVCIYSRILLFSVFSYISLKLYYGHLPRCALVRSFLLLLRRGGRKPLDSLTFYCSELVRGHTECFLVVFNICNLKQKYPPHTQGYGFKMKKKPVPCQIYRVGKYNIEFASQYYTL